MPEYKLIYFNVPGRAELARLLFHYGGQEFEDCRFERSEWPQVKDSEWRQDIFFEQLQTVFVV